ncbi:Uncharacterised protein [Bordetella pertussis]|nr:Uncharacterised protein [Bordetella pertussis]
MSSSRLPLHRLFTRNECWRRGPGSSCVAGSCASSAWRSRPSLIERGAALPVPGPPGWPAHGRLSREAQKSGHCAESSRKSASPAKKASEAFTCAPVSARNSPVRPGMRLSSQLPPTSGNSPMVISGMAMRVVSLTTRWLAPIIRPTPPPMTMPWPQHSTGLG